MRPTHPTLALIRDAQKGLPSAEEELVELIRAPLTEFVGARVGSHLRTRIDVEDVIQETLFKALRSLGTFEWQGEGSFLRWVKGIASNEILRLAKRERRRGSASLISLEPAEIPGAGSSPSHGLRRAERFERLEQALAGLSPDHRQVILLARIKGMPLTEVAERMGRTPNAVAQLLGRALSKLKERFGDTESLSLPPESLDPSERGGDRAQGERRVP